LLATKFFSSMFTLSAFADEISPDPQFQIDVLLRCGVRHIELRSIGGINVLDLTNLQLGEFKSLLDRHGMHLSAIGSPIGKVRIDQPFEPHLRRFEHALKLCQRLGTRKVRVFSYYKPLDSTWEQWRPEILDRMTQEVRLAEKAGAQLLHENEHAIYGDDPRRVVDLFSTINSPSFRAVYDAANYVVCGFDPIEAWRQTRSWTAHLHIKDWVAGQEHGCLAGEGQGQWPDVISDAAGWYDGFATLEPHLQGGGPTGGVTGPDLFPQAVAAFKALLGRAGAQYR
jgi:sugar phosphate isomerase/epimerase